MTRTENEVAEQVERAADRLSRRRAGVVLGAGTPGRFHVASRGVTGRADSDSDSDSEAGAGAGAPNAHTLFEIGSITKVFTALLLADGVVRGQWRLDSPVRELLPASVTLPSRDGVEITLMHLATHTSGLPRSPSRLGLRENIAYLRRGTDPYAGLRAADVLDGLHGTRLRHRPGTGTPRYSNLGFGLLGIALSAATGADFGTLVWQRICGPLAMADTVTDDQMTAGHRERMAAGHRTRRRGAEQWPLTGIPGAGALRSTAADMERFLAAQLDPATTELDEAIRLCQSPAPGGPEQMGLGWHFAGPGTLWHNGGTGGFRSIIVVDRRQRLGAVALVNQTRGADLQTFRLLRDLRS